MAVIKTKPVDKVERPEVVNSVESLKLRLAEVRAAQEKFSQYTQEQVDAMFQALEGRVAEVKSRFAPKKAPEGKSFSFDAIE